MKSENRWIVVWLMLLFGPYLAGSLVSCNSSDGSVVINYTEEYWAGEIRNVNWEGSNYYKDIMVIEVMNCQYVLLQRGDDDLEHYADCHNPRCQAARMPCPEN